MLSFPVDPVDRLTAYPTARDANWELPEMLASTATKLLSRPPLGPSTSPEQHDIQSFEPTQPGGWGKGGAMSAMSKVAAQGCGIQTGCRESDATAPIIVIRLAA